MTCQQTHSQKSTPQSSLGHHTLLLMPACSQHSLNKHAQAATRIQCSPSPTSRRHQTKAYLTALALLAADFFPRHAPNPIPIACVHCGGRVAKREGAGGDEARALRAGYALDARVSDVAPARSCASVERHGACPSAGSFSVRLEGPATLWGALRGPPPRASSVLHPCMTPVGQWPSGIFLRRQSLPWL